MNISPTDMSSGTVVTDGLDGQRPRDTSIDVPFLTRLYRTAMRRRWVLLSTILAVLIAGLVVTLMMTKLYTATTSIEIAREGGRVTDIRSVEREVDANDLEFYQTQYGLLSSDSLADQVARSLRLGEDRSFFEAFGLDPSQIAGGAGATPAAREARIRSASKILLANVSISPVRGSRLVNIGFTSPSPTLSANVANAWAENFIQRNLARRYDASSYARKFLENRLSALRQKLEESERQAVAYAAQQGIVNLPGTVDRTTGATVGERSLVGEQASRLNDELSTATAARIQAQSQLDSAKSGAAQGVLDNPAINQLRQRRAEAQADYAKLMVQFEPDYPPARALAQQVASLDRAIAREEGRVTQSIRDAYNASQERERTLRGSVGALENSLTDLRRRSIQYNIYQREVDTNRQLYDALLQRYKEIGVAGGVGTNNISIVDRADVPTRPSKPNLPLNLSLALLLGLVAGTGLTWLLEQVSEGVTDPTDVPRQLGLSLLGAVPVAESDVPLDELRNPRSPMVEAYLGIHANLRLSTAHGAPRSISVTSTRPREGKSITSYAIAHSFARARHKVILIDADMRSPMVHKEFELSNKRGVSNFLAGDDDLSQSIHASPLENLSIMTAGPQPPNAADLLTGDRMQTLIASLLKEFDHVVVDAPPVMGLADAPLISRAVEGTIYAVEARVIRTSLVRIALQRLQAANANLLGVVLTKFEAQHSSYGYGYDYGYGYGRKADA